MQCIFFSDSMPLNIQQDCRNGANVLHKFSALGQVSGNGKFDITHFDKIGSQCGKRITAFVGGIPTFSKVHTECESIKYDLHFLLSGFHEIVD